LSNYIIRRTALAIITFFGITMLVYFMSTLAPGSPLDALLADPGMTKEEVVRRSAELGLDKPVYIQYFKWLNELLHGNMGYSYTSYRPVVDVVTERIAATLVLTVSAIVLSYIIGIPLGIISSLKPYSILDYIMSTLAFIMSGVPGFFLGMMLIYIFSVKLKILPFGGMYDASGATDLLVLIKHLVLPTFAIAIPEIGKVMRHVRSNMLEVLTEDYVKTARAKGVKEWGVIIIHAFRNTLIPIITIFSGSFPFMIGGSVVVERVFGWPGLGTLMINSITSRDYPIIMGISVIVAIVVLATNLLVDILYAYLDPRITYN